MDDAGQEATGDRTIHNNDQLTQHLIQLGQHISTVVQRGASDVMAHFDSTIRGVTAFPSNGMLPAPPSHEHDSSVRQLQEKVARLEAVQGSFQVSEAKRRSLEDENLTQEKKYKELEIDLRKARADLQKARAEAKLLNSLLIKGRTDDNERLDDEICKEFRGLGNDILKLVHKSFQAKTVSYHHHRGKPTKRQTKWLDGWTRLLPELRNYRARGAIFRIVFEAFFDTPYFGFGGKGGRMEKGLRDFELLMEESGKISPADTIEWRRRTVNAAKALGQVAETPELAATEICETLTPVISPSGPTTAFDKATYSEVLEICLKAEQISLVLRQSRATFSVDVARGVDKIDVQEDSRVELVAIEDGTSSTSVQFGYTVFGGLTKTTLIPGEVDAVVTLMKPDVVGYV